MQVEDAGWRILQIFIKTTLELHPRTVKFVCLEGQLYCQSEKKIFHVSDIIIQQIFPGCLLVPVRISYKINQLKTTGSQPLRNSHQCEQLQYSVTMSMMSTEDSRRQSEQEGVLKVVTPGLSRDGNRVNQITQSGKWNLLCVVQEGGFNRQKQLQKCCKS